MAEGKNNLLEAFKNRQATKNNKASQEALQLVNLYRSLSYFNPEFVDKYNQMLLSSSSAVQRLLRNFMGGDEVENYLEFLRHSIHFSDSDDQSVLEMQKKGYLPQPDSDIQSDKNSVEKVVISKEDWEQLKENQKSLQDRLKLLLGEIENMKKKGGEPTQKVSSRMAPYTPSLSENYSEIVEEKEEEPHE